MNGERRSLWIRTRCASEDDFVLAFARLAGERTLFVPVPQPALPGAPLPFAMLLTDGRPVLSGQARVVSVRGPGDPAGKPGMQLELVQLDDGATRLFRRLLDVSRAFAPVGGASKTIMGMAPAPDVMALVAAAASRGPELETLNECMLDAEVGRPASSDGPPTQQEDDLHAPLPDGDDDGPATVLEQRPPSNMQGTALAAVPPPPVAPRPVLPPSPLATTPGPPPVVARPSIQPQPPLPVTGTAHLPAPAPQQPAEKKGGGLVLGLIIGFVVGVAAGFAVAWFYFRSHVPTIGAPVVTPAPAQVVTPQPAAPAPAPVAPAPVVTPPPAATADAAPPPPAIDAGPGPGKPLEAPAQPAEENKVAASPPPAPQGACKVTVITRPPGASLTVGGKKLGDTPVDLELPCDVGVDLELEKPRYAPVTQRIKPHAGKDLEVKVNLPRPDVTLMIASMPAGASITVDGATVGTTPAKVQVDGFIRHKVTVSLKGYETASTTVNAGKDTAIELELKKTKVKPGALVPR